MKLSILIPTFNRSVFLVKNLEILSSHIRKANLQENIEIVVSNNQSTDDTHENVKQFIEINKDIIIQYFLQEKNIGLEKNALFVLKEAKGEYVMYLGDDDYIEYEYLYQVYNKLYEKNDLSAIIPSNIPIDEDGRLKSLVGRDTKLASRKFKKGFKNCLINSWRGHQLSGLTLKRDGLLESYINQSVGNIYLFIYLLAFNCLRGSTFHFTDYPVKITDVTQNKKDWGYGDDGLLNEIFDNYNRLQINTLKKTLLQINHYRVQSWRLWRYKRKKFINAFNKIWFSSNSTTLFKLIFPFAVFNFKIINKAKTLIKFFLNH